MARGKKTGGKDFQPGQSGNPAGMPPMSPEFKALRKITREKLEEIADLILDGDRSTLQMLANSFTEPAIRVAYARAALNAMQKGDLTQIEIILNRLVGKPKDKVELTGKDGEAIKFNDSEAAAKLAAIFSAARERKENEV